MLSLQSQIDELQRQIASAGLAGVVGPDQRPARRLPRRLGRPKMRCRRGSAQLKGDVLNLRGRSIQYTILQREVDTNRSLYDALLQRYKQIGVAGGVGMAPVSIVDRAEAPTLAVQAEPVPEPAPRTWARACSPESPVRSASSSSTTRSRAAKTCASKLSLPCLGAVPKTPAKRHLRRRSEEPDLDHFGSLFGDRRGAPVQHRGRECRRSCW